MAHAPSPLSNATPFRRTTAGLCLIFASLFLLAGDVLGTRGPTNQRDFLADIARHPARDAASVTVAIYGFARLVPAVIGLAHLLRHRAVILSSSPTPRGSARPTTARRTGKIGKRVHEAS